MAPYQGAGSNWQNPSKVAGLLARKQQLLELAETKLADLGCGGGCVGRYFASGFGADVEGIDADPLAIRMAEELAVTSGGGASSPVQDWRRLENGMEG